MSIFGGRKGKLLLVFTCLIFISSCSGGGENNEIEDSSTQGEKTDFYVETQLGNTFVGGGILEKVGQVSTSQNLSISANASGRIANIFVKVGDNVSQGKDLVKLDDTIGSYGINLDRAKNGVDRAKINYESQKNTLEKQIFDAEINLKNLERSLSTLRQDSEQNIIQATDTFDQSQDTENIQKLDLQIEKLVLQKEKLTLQEEKLDIQIQKIQESIEKSRLDYDLRIVSDTQVVENYSATLQTQYITLQLFLDDIIEFSDEILGVTFLNRNENDRFEDYLGANDSTQKTLSETRLRNLIEYRNSEEFLELQNNITNAEFTEDSLQNIMQSIDTGYQDSKVFLSSLETTLNNSIKSIGSLGDTEINTFISQINIYQSQLQGNYGGFLSFESGVETFFATLDESQNSVLRAIELQELDLDSLEKDKISLTQDASSLQKDIALLEKDKQILIDNLESGELSAGVGLERTKINIADSIASLETQILSAKNTLTNTRTQRDISLKSLQNAIDDAQISYNSALKEFEKLSIQSPINGSISELLVDVGQEVNIGTPLFNIVNARNPELEISFSKSERDFVNIGQSVSLQIDEQIFSGTIITISDVADKNLNYVATISLDAGEDIVGKLVSVQIPIETKKMLLPLNIISTQGGDIGTVKILDEGILRDVRVRMGDIYNEYVEIVSCAENCEDLNIVINDVSNFDINTFTIVEK